MSTEKAPKSQTKTPPPAPTRLASRFQVAWKTAATRTRTSAKKVIPGAPLCATTGRGQYSVPRRWRKPDFGALGDPGGSPARLAHDHVASRLTRRSTAGMRDRIEAAFENRELLKD